MDDSSELIAESVIDAEVDHLRVRDAIAAWIVKRWPRTSRRNARGNADGPELAAIRGDATQLRDLIRDAAIAERIASAARRETTMRAGSDARDWEAREGDGLLALVERIALDKR